MIFTWDFFFLSLSLMMPLLLKKSNKRKNQFCETHSVFAEILAV